MASKNSKNEEENLRLKLELEKKNKEIEKIRSSHSNITPSIYIQNSHSEQLWDCKKIPKNILLILLGNSGVSSSVGHELLLTKPEVVTLLKNPINNKSEMDKRLKDLREHFPMLTFHYSDYYGIKPIGDKKRKKCRYNTTESYYDLMYTDPAVFEDSEVHIPIRKIGFTTLDQLQNFVDIHNEPLNPEFYNSLDILPAHTLDKILDLNGRYLNTENRKYNVNEIKKYIPYFDIRHPEKGKKFDSIEDIYMYHYEKIYQDLPMGESDLKLSQLMKVNGPGIYIHYACRPFIHAEDDSFEVYNETTKEAEKNFQPTRLNSLNTLIAASCPINRRIVASGFNNNISGLYRGCDTLEEVLITSNVTKINFSAFFYCSNLKIVEFEPNSNLEILGNESFGLCRSLERIELPDSINNIEEKMFYNCSSLKYIKFPKNLLSIKTQMCINNINLEEIVFPEKLEIIEADAFNNCKKLINLNFPASLKTIEPNAFKGCTSLRKVTMYQEIDYPFDCEVIILTQPSPSSSVPVLGKKQKKKKKTTKKKQTSKKPNKKPGRKPSKKKKHKKK